MTITHTEGYFLTWDVGPEVIELIRQRMMQKYGDIQITEDKKGIHFYARMSEEGNNEGSAVQHFDSTNRDKQRDQEYHGADGYLGMVDDTGSDQV